MKRTLWKWAAPVAVLALVVVWASSQEANQRASAQDANKPVPVGGPSALPGSDGSSAPYNPGPPNGSKAGADPFIVVPVPTVPDSADGRSLGSGDATRPDRATRRVDVVDSNGQRSQIHIWQDQPIGSTLTVRDGSGVKVLTVMADPNAPYGDVYRALSEGGGGMPGGAGPPGMITPAGQYRRVVTRESFNQVKLVPLTAEEVLESKQFRDLLQHLSDATKTEAEKELGRKQLTELLEKQFTRDFDTREKDVVELEAKVKKLREQLDKRKAAKEKIIELRMTTIQNEIDGLGFPGGAGMITGGGFTAPDIAPGDSYGPRLREGLQPVPDPYSAAPSHNAFSPADYPSTRRPVSRDELESEKKSRSPKSSGTRPILDNEPALKDSSSFKPDPIDPLNEAAGSFPVAAKNLILNGEFEMFDRQEDRAEYWDNLVPQGSEHKRVDGQGIDGTAAFLIRNAETFGDSQSVVSQEINYTEGSYRIRFSAQVKCDTDAGKRVVIGIRFINGQGIAQDVQPDTDPFHGNGQWCRYECAAAIPKDTQKIIFKIGNKGPGDLWLDALRAEYLDGSPGGNLLGNPSFEDGPAHWGTGANPETVEYKIGDKGGTNLTRAAIIHKTADKYFPIAEWTQEIKYDGQSPVVQLSAAVKTENATKAILDVLFLDDKGEWIKHEWAAYIGDPSDEPKPLTHDWKEYKGAVAIPAGTKQIVIGLQDYGPGTVWFDDVSAVYLKELPKEPNNVPR